MSKNQPSRSHRSGLIDVSCILCAAWILWSIPAAARPFEPRSTPAQQTPQSSTPDATEENPHTGVEEGENPDEWEIEPDVAPDPGETAYSHDPTGTEMVGTTMIIAMDSRVTRTLEARGPSPVHVFAFRLTHPQTVVVTTAGPTDTLGTLLDSNQRVVATDDDGDREGSFRMQAHLAPGLYFVRVEGSWGSRGPYTLHLRSRR